MIGFCQSKLGVYHIYYWVYLVLSHIMLGLYAVCSLRDTHILF